MKTKIYRVDLNGRPGYFRATPRMTADRVEKEARAMYPMRYPRIAITVTLIPEMTEEDIKIALPYLIAPTAEQDAIFATLPDRVQKFLTMTAGGQS